MATRVRLNRHSVAIHLTYLFPRQVRVTAHEVGCYEEDGTEAGFHEAEVTAVRTLEAVIESQYRGITALRDRSLYFDGSEGLLTQKAKVLVESIPANAVELIPKGHSGQLAGRDDVVVDKDRDFHLADGFVKRVRIRRELIYPVLGLCTTR